MGRGDEPHPREIQNDNLVTWRTRTDRNLFSHINFDANPRDPMLIQGVLTALGANRLAFAPARLCRRNEIAIPRVVEL